MAEKEKVVDPAVGVGAAFMLVLLPPAQLTALFQLGVEYLRGRVFCFGQINFIKVNEEIVRRHLNELFALFQAFYQNS